MNFYRVYRISPNGKEIRSKRVKAESSSKACAEVKFSYHADFVGEVREPQPSLAALAYRELVEEKARTGLYSCDLYSN